MDPVRAWIEKSPYGAALGVRVDALAQASARLLLPYKEENSNPGRALHGGVAASLIAMGGQSLTRIALGEEAAPWHSAGLQVNYLSAALGETVVAEATLLRRGKELCFVDVAVTTEAGKPVARGLVTGRGRFGAAAEKTRLCEGDDGAAEPGRMGPHIERVPFMGRLGLRVEHMQDARSRIVLPYKQENADEGGGVHEGAVLALLDTTGAMAAWALTGPGRYKASTPGLQAQILRPPPREDLVAFGRVVHRDRELFWSQVEAADVATRRLVARGTVIYRIVVPQV